MNLLTPFLSEEQIALLDERCHGWQPIANLTSAPRSSIAAAVDQV